MKIVDDIGKSSCEHGREQKFRRILYPLSHEHPLCSSKELIGDGLQRTVCEQFTNPVLITQTSSLRMKCSQVYTQLYGGRVDHPSSPSEPKKKKTHCFAKLNEKCLLISRKIFTNFILNSLSFIHDFYVKYSHLPKFSQQFPEISSF